MSSIDSDLSKFSLLTEFPRDCTADYWAALADQKEQIDCWFIFAVPEAERDGILRQLDGLEVHLFAQTLAESWEQTQSQLMESRWLLLLPSGFRLRPAAFPTPLSNAGDEHQTLAITCSDALGMQRRLPLLVRGVAVSDPPKLDGWSDKDANYHVYSGFELFAAAEDRFEHRRAAQQLSSGGGLDALAVGLASELSGDSYNAINAYDVAANDVDVAVPRQWLALLRSALLREKLQRPAAEINALCQQAVELWPERIEPIILLARQLRLAGEVARAVSLLEMCVDVPVADPQFPHLADDYKLGYLREQIACQAHNENDAQVVELTTEYYRRTKGQPADELYRQRDEAWERLNPALPINIEAQPYFVIIIAFRNARDWLQACVDSIAEQSWPYYRVILIDDDSDDNAMAELDTSALQEVERVTQRVRCGALANQVQALKGLIEPRDIAVFVDGDDQLAHPTVLQNLAKFYSDHGCWVSYGSARHTGSDRRGYARPILAGESIESLFQGNPLVFPIHLRSHRVGLFHRLLEQDPDLHCLRCPDGDFIAHASDVAHMRAMMLLAGHRRCRYNPEVLYLYNDQNPASHFRTAAAQLRADVNHIASQPALQTCHSYLPGDQQGDGSRQAARRGATRLLVINVEGCEPDLIAQYSQAGLMPNFARASLIERQIEIEEGFANDIFWRGLLSGKEVGHYANFFRLALAPKGYRDLNVFTDDAWATIDGFWNDLGLAGRQVGVFNPSDLRLTQKIPNVTQFSNWLLHAPTGHPSSDPDELVAVLQALNPRPELQRTYDSLRIEPADKCAELLSNICAAEAAKVSAYRRLLDRGDWDLFICGLDATHDVMHQLWHFHDPASPYYDGSVEDPVPLVYRRLDRSIGELLDAAGPAPVAIVCGLGSRAQRSMNSMLDAIIRALETDYRGEQPGKERWQRWFYTFATAPLSGLIRLNVQGRDSVGLIPADEYDACCERLIGDLHDLRFQNSGDPVVEKIVRIPLEHPGPYADRLADLMVIWAENRFDEAVVSPLFGAMTYQPNPNNVLDFRTGDHNNHAALYVNAAFAGEIDLGISEEIRYTEVAQLLAQVALRSQGV